MAGVVAATAIDLSTVTSSLACEFPYVDLVLVDAAVHAAHLHASNWAPGGVPSADTIERLARLRLRGLEAL
jgi:hypothetical protein